MDRSFPSQSPGFGASAWAYERPAAGLTPSSSYGATHIETELLHRQSYTSAHTAPTYTTSQHSTGLSGVFDTNLHSAGSSTTESSVLNFLSSIESRGLQAGPAATTLLPQFRTPTWQTGTNASTELFLTGALPSSGTFPTPAALSSFQHPSTFPPRSFASSSALTVQDTTFSPSNGLLSPSENLLQIKSPQSTVPTAIPFDRLGGASLAAGLPPQSSTYRSAQESAPHLLQPQFSLLPSALGSSQQASSQPYGVSVFSGSIERALQRECSVIKHHQRPSSTQSAPEPLPGSMQHSLQNYLPDNSTVSYQQDPSRHTPVPSSPAGDSTQAINVKAQQETTSSSVPSPGFSSSSGAKAKDGSSKISERHSESTEPHIQTASSAQKQGSVIASQSQPYSSAQLPSLMSISPSQTYITSQSLLSNLSQTQAFSPGQPEKLPSIYKPMPSFVSQSDNVTPSSQSLIYSSSQQQVLSSAADRDEYEAQVQGLCMGNPSQNYSSSHSQVLTAASYYAQEPASASPSQSYTSDPSLSSSPPFSSSRVHSLPTSSSTQDYIITQPSPGSKVDGLQHSQKYLLPIHSPTSSSSTYTHALQNNQSSVELKQVYGKRKQDESMFLSSKEGSGELSIQDVQALQQQTSTQTITHSDVGVQNNVVYVVSKVEDRHNTQSVIRSNSRSEDSMTGLMQMSSVKDERMSALGERAQLVSSTHTHVTSGPKNSSTLMQSPHVALSTDQLKQHSLLLKAPTIQQESLHTQNSRTTVQQPDHRQVPQDQTQYVRIPSAPVLLDPTQMILLQQPLLHAGPNQSKPMVQMQPVPIQYLQMNNEIVNSAGSTHGNSQQNHQGSSESSKQHMAPKDNFSSPSNPHDAKQHFTLNSVCFPDSMLLADERNILSNVDDILAATAAACGVTPQDFKSTSSEGDMPIMSNPSDSKCHFQLVDNRQETNSFSSQNMILTNTQTMTLALNGAQMTANVPKDTGGHQEFTLANSHMQHSNSKQDMSEKVTNCHAKTEVLTKGHCVNISNNSSNGSNVNTTAHDHSDFHLAGQDFNPVGLMKMDSLSKNNLQPKGIKNVKMEAGTMECSSDGLPRKKVKSKSCSKQSGEDENGQIKSQKRTSQAKQQNSRGSETSSSSTSEGYDSYQQQERMRQKIREVEEKQPEVKTGFIGSFLDFLKSGPKQPFSNPPIRSPNRTRKPSVSKRLSNQQLPAPLKFLPQSTQLDSANTHTVNSTKRLDEELQKNLETLPSFSSDEDESAGKNQDLQKSITSALSSLDDLSDVKQKSDSTSSEDVTKKEQPSSAQSTDAKPQEHQKLVQKEVSAEELVKNVPPDQLAVQLSSVAIEGLTDEELSDSEGEGMYRERDEFVVKNEEIESLKITLKAGVEPPAIWKVQKALLQKFIPELRDGKRVFSATNSYLGYFGDAKTMYQRVYVKFLDTVNKREYVRVCSRKPRCKPMHSMRGCQMKALLAHSAAAPSDSSTLKTNPKPNMSKPRSKQPKTKAEPPPKKRKKWKEEFSTPPIDSSPEAGTEDDEFTPPVPFASRFLNTRTMKETFRSFVELLISVALDADVMIALERENDELLLPHMKKVEGMITDNRRRLLPKLRMGQVFKNALDSFPELSVVTELKTDGETPTFKVRLSGRAYNKKTMKPSKAPVKLPLEYAVDQQKAHWFSLYHSLQHYKYHTYLMCMEEVSVLRSRGVDLGQEETVQKCMGNRAWLEGLFERFGELLTQVQQACL
ncbi:glutamine and serine-rich protein 1 [Hoplias malabaricus]|uniref:glutamine and serine-rich protein 1 n=1 Tax=Hoplias malabaricus TaxID=27720 RepID=UPI0034620289